MLSANFSESSNLIQCIFPKFPMEAMPLKPYVLYFADCPIATIPFLTSVFPGSAPPAYATPRVHSHGGFVIKYAW